MSKTLQYLIDLVGNEHIFLVEAQDSDFINECSKNQLEVESHATYDHITLI